MKIISANGDGPRMNRVFLSGYGDGDYTPLRSTAIPNYEPIIEFDPWEPLMVIMFAVYLNRYNFVLSYLHLCCLLPFSFSFLFIFYVILFHSLVLSPTLTLHHQE